ncbi:MAG: YebC/PmpR family DNA-binding transcriptional regulator [Clostridia bacterium]|nr:YebC/PmpR family DNA-binding transcriptional regulator [Clostridia bacterium]
MSGHSKWKNIMHKKEKTDAQRAKVFTKIGKEMAIAIRDGGPDPVSNGKLADLITKAKSLNVPNDNIKRVIEKYSGNEAVNYDEITYEGYGPSGVAVIVTTATDNKNRTAGNVRHYFDKFGGNLGSSGCVSYMFTDAGVIVVDGASVKDEDQLMEDALEAGASDFSAEDGAFEVTTEVNDLAAVRDALIAKGYTILSAEEDKIPSSYIELTDEKDIENMNKMLEHLEDDDDVQNVYHNWENCD